MNQNLKDVETILYNTAFENKYIFTLLVCFISFHIYVEITRLRKILNLTKDVFKGRRWFEFFFHEGINR
jgi:hypothetical protein